MFDLTRARVVPTSEWKLVEDIDGKFHLLVTDDGPTWNSIVAFDPATGRTEAGASFRQKLSADLTLYVRTDGADTNTGRDPVLDAFATFQGAYEYVCRSLDTAGYTVTIRAAGSGVRVWSSATEVIAVTRGWVGGGSLRFIGDPTSPQNCVLRTTADAGTVIYLTGARPGIVTFDGFSYESTVTGDYGLIACYGSGDVEIGYPLSGAGNNRFGASGSAHIFSQNSVTIGVYGDIGIYGSCASHVYGRGGGRIDYFPNTVTVESPINVGGAFIRAAETSYVQAFASVGFVNANNVTGKKYRSDFQATIQSYGSGVDYFPGTVAGTVNNGFYY